MPLRTLLSIVLCLGFACVGRAVNAAAADSPPTADEVEQYIAITLPGYWKVDQLSLSDPVDYGNPIDPEWRWRYEALIAPKEPLYVDGGHHEGVVLLELNFSPESPQTLYGVAIATFQAGTWSGEARHENRPFDHGGQPASFFSGRTVVAGSPEERELREATQRGELEELEAKHKAERAVVKIQHQAALVTAKDAHRAALERLKVEHDAERERREAEHQNELAVQLTALEADLKAEAERRRVESTESEKLTELTAEARDKLTALQAAEAERFAAASDRLTALQAEEAEMLAASERFYEARRVELKKLFDRLGVVTGPDDYLALLDTAGESELDWMRVAVLRHGLGGDDLALSRAAWRHLLQADMNSNPELRSLLADYVAHLKDNPDVLADYVANLQDNPDLVLPIVNELLPSLSGYPEALKVIKDTLPSISQWASEVVEFSSQYGNSDYAAAQVLGEPNVPGCSDHGRAWTTTSANAGKEYVRVRFANPVWFPEIGVHESHSVGAIRKIILWDAEGDGIEYDVQDPLSKCPGVAEFQFDEYTKPVNELTIVLDTRAVSGWNEIDAISLSGKVLEVK